MVRVEVGLFGIPLGVCQVPDAQLVARVAGRRLDPVTGTIYHLTFDPPPEGEVSRRVVQRGDDTEAKVRVRLDQHRAQVAGLRAFYGPVMATVDGARPKDAVYRDIRRHLREALDAAATRMGRLPPHGEGQETAD